MTEALFYHLERSRLEDALPLILEKALERGMRCLVKCGDAERAAHLDDHLWTYRDDAFMAHGQAGDSYEDRQLVLISLEDGAANGADVLFAVAGAKPDKWDGFERICVMFDGGDEMALNDARVWWKEAKAAAANVTYWRQTPRGGWEKGA